MTQPHDPDTRRQDADPATRDGAAAAEARPPAEPPSEQPAEQPSGRHSREERPQLSTHPRPPLRRLGRGAVALAAIAVIVLLSTLTLRFARRSVDSIAAEAPPAPLAQTPLAIQRIEEMRAHLPAPPMPPEETLPELLPAPPPPPTGAARREPSDHRAAWRSPLTHRSARTAGRPTAGGPAPGEPVADSWSSGDPSLPPDLAATLRALTTAPPLTTTSPGAAPFTATAPDTAPAPPTALPGHPSTAAPSPAPPPSSNLLAAPTTTATRWADPVAPPSPYLLRAGTMLPAVLAQRIVSDQPGLVRAVVARDVRDSLAGAHLLVPRGTVLLGRQGSLPGFGQDRLAVVWTRLLFPDGRALDLGAGGGSPAASASRDGTAGLTGRVRHHWGRRYAAAALLSLVGAGVQLSQPQGGSLLEPDSPGAQAAGALGRELGRTSADVLRRYGDLPPTIELAPGARVHAVLLEDLAFASPYPTFR